MKVTITLNKQTYHRDIPIRWEDRLLTFGDLIKLNPCGQDVLKVIALLTRLPYDDLKKAYIKDLDRVVEVLGFLKKPMTLPDYRSIKILHGYPLPKGLEFEEAGMYLDLQNYLKESEKLTDLEKLERYTVYCAVYACKHRHGKYDWKLAEEMAPVFLNAPCTEVMAVGNFTLLRLIGYNLNTNLGSLKAGWTLKKFRLGLKAFMIRMGSTYHWTILLKKLGLKRMNY